MHNFVTKQGSFAPAPILIFPVRGRSRERTRISVCIRVILKHYTFTLEGWDTIRQGKYRKQIESVRAFMRECGVRARLH